MCFEHSLATGAKWIKRCVNLLETPNQWHIFGSSRAVMYTDG